MQLSSEQFQQILSSLRSDGDGRAKERRKSPRVGVRNNLPIILIHDGGRGDVRKVFLRDISDGGLGILSTVKIETDSQFIARFPGQNGEMELILVCTVKNCRPMGSEFHAVGASFTKRIREIPKARERAMAAQNGADRSSANRTGGKRAGVKRPGAADRPDAEKPAQPAMAVAGGKPTEDADPHGEQLADEIANLIANPDLAEEATRIRKVLLES